MKDDLELQLETTWIENTATGYDRVVVLNYFTRDIFSSDPTVMLQTVGQLFRNRIADKLQQDIGLAHDEDFIFAYYDQPEMDDGYWLSKPKTADNRIIIRIRDEEHFAMFKMHYSN